MYVYLKGAWYNLLEYSKIETSSKNKTIKFFKAGFPDANGFQNNMSLVETLDYNKKDFNQDIVELNIALTRLNKR